MNLFKDSVCLPVVGKHKDLKKKLHCTEHIIPFPIKPHLIDQMERNKINFDIGMKLHRNTERSC